MSHIEKAASYITRGAEFYRKAAIELTAAREEGYTWKTISEGVGRSQSWCKELVAKGKSGQYSAPFAGEYGGVKTRLTTSMLKDAPMEEIERVIEKLPRERRNQIGRAFDHPYSTARADFADRERNLSEREKQEREAAVEQITKPARQMVADFGSMTIVNHLETALEKLSELVADSSLSTRAVRQIDRAYEALGAELEVARALVGIER